MKLVPALFAGALAVVAAQDSSLTGTDAPVTEASTTTVAPLVCEDGFVKSKGKCVSLEDRKAKVQKKCNRKNRKTVQFDYIDSLITCTRNVDSMRAQCEIKNGNATGKELNTVRERDLSATQKSNESDKKFRERVLGKYKCKAGCPDGQERLGKKKQCTACPPAAENNPFGLEYSVVEVKGVRTCKRACTGLSKRDKKTGGCKLDNKAKETVPQVVIPEETEGVPSVLQELLAGAFTRMHTDHGRGRRRRAGKPVKNPNPTVVRLAFHASMGKADTCLDTAAPFNGGLEDLHVEYTASHSLFKHVWNAMKHVAPADPDMCTTDKTTGDCKLSPMKGPDGQKLRDNGTGRKGKGKPINDLAKPFWTRSLPRKFKYDQWQHSACKNFKTLLSEVEGIDQLWTQTRLNKDKTMELLCSFVNTQLFPADLTGPLHSEATGYKATFPSEKVMSQADYFAFQYVEALQKTLPIKYNKDCNEVKMVLKKKKLNEDGTESSIKCYDPATNDGKQVDYLKMKYGRQDSTDCAADLPDSTNLPDGGQNFNFNLQRMQSVFPGMSAEDMTLLLGAHTLGATHAEASGFRTGTWVNCPGNLNVKYFSLVRNENWSPFFDAGNQTTAFRMVLTDDECVEFDKQQGRGCTEIEQNGEMWKVKSREIKSLDFDRERGNIPVDIGLVYDFDGSNPDFFSNGLALQTQDADGNAFAYPRTVSGMTTDEQRSPAWPTIEKYTNRPNKTERNKNAANFLLDFIPTFQKMIENGYSSDFNGDQSLGHLVERADSGELYEACIKLYADDFKRAKHEIGGLEPRNREKERMQHCYHFDEDKLDDGDGFEDEDEEDTTV